MADDPKEDLDWENAHAIWAAGDFDIPARRDDERIHLLADLKIAAGMFSEFQRVTTVDRDRTWSPDQVVRLCRQLLEILYEFDDVVLARMARVRNPDGEPTKLEGEIVVADVLGSLAQLEYLMERVQLPNVTRKHKHEFNELLVIRLADIFERTTGRKASVTTDWDTSVRRGVFVDFVQEFTGRMLPSCSPDIGGRVIQRALELRKKWADVDRDDTQISD